MDRKKVVLCGSMQFIDQMKTWRECLEERGYQVDLPTLIDFHRIRDEEGDLEEFERIKRRETKNHFEKVGGADILLILNYNKDGNKDYIGGNTFAEISYAVALNYCHGKNIDIFTVNPLPKYVSYYEELKAWKVRQWPESLDSEVC